MPVPPADHGFVGAKREMSVCGIRALERLLRPVSADFYDLFCFFCEDCSPHTCKLHWAAIRSNRGQIRKLWIRSGRGTKSENRPWAVPAATGAAKEPAR